MTQKGRPPRTYIVEIPVTINVIEVRTLCLSNKHRTPSHCLEGPHRAVYSTGKAPEGFLVERS